MTPEKKYQIVNGTHYDIHTPREVIEVLEHSRRTKQRIIIVYGQESHDYGLLSRRKVYRWQSATPHRGHVGRSTGSKPIPLLIRTARSLGGEAIIDQCIVEIKTSAGGKLLYRLED